jgi:hypothetical protein
VKDDPPKEFVTENVPGSDWQKFIYKGTYGPLEDFVLLRSGGTLTGPAFSITANLKLTAPASIPSALNSIEVGYVQFVTLSPLNSATASYQGTTLTRVGVHRAASGLDWMPAAGPIPINRFPWYVGEPPVTQNPTSDGTVTTWTGTISTNDTPTAGFPKFFNGIAQTGLINKDGMVETYSVYVGVRTKDDRNVADLNYFTAADGKVKITWRYPIDNPNAPVAVLSVPFTAAPAPTPLPNLHITPASVLWTSTPGRGFLLWKNSAQ